MNPNIQSLLAMLQQILRPSLGATSGGRGLQSGGQSGVPTMGVARSRGIGNPGTPIITPTTAQTSRSPMFSPFSFNNGVFGLGYSGGGYGLPTGPLYILGGMRAYSGGGFGLPSAGYGPTGLFSGGGGGLATQYQSGLAFNSGPSPFSPPGAVGGNQFSPFSLG